jgi:hypothetical protein
VSQHEQLSVLGAVAAQHDRRDRQQPPVTLYSSDKICDDLRGTAVLSDLEG